MKRVIVCFAVLTSVAGQASAGPCVPMKWSDYVALTGAGSDCTIGNFKVSDFTFDPGSSELTADKIFATPTGLGFKFVLTDFKVTNPIKGQTSSRGLSLGFKIADAAGKMTIASEHLMMGDTEIDNGDATIEDKSTSISVNVIANRLTTSKDFDPKKDMVSFEGALSVGTGMNLGANSQLKDFTINYTAVPEPGAFVLLGTGIAGMLALRGSLKGRRGPALPPADHAVLTSFHAATCPER